MRTLLFAAIFAVLSPSVVEAKCRYQPDSPTFSDGLADVRVAVEKTATSTWRTCALPEARRLDHLYDRSTPGVVGRACFDDHISGQYTAWQAVIAKCGEPLARTDAGRDYANVARCKVKPLGRGLYGVKRCR